MSTFMLNNINDGFSSIALPNRSYRKCEKNLLFISALPHTSPNCTCLNFQVIYRIKNKIGQSKRNLDLTVFLGNYRQQAVF